MLSIKILFTASNAFGDLFEIKPYNKNLWIDVSVILITSIPRMPSHNITSQNGLINTVVSISCKLVVVSFCNVRNKCNSLKLVINLCRNTSTLLSREEEPPKSNKPPPDDPLPVKDIRPIHYDSKTQSKLNVQKQKQMLLYFQ